MQIDYVITYVDGSDPEWQREYEKVSGKKINAEKSERFRSWDNLRYNLRAVEKNLPFIRKVHLVVSGPSQVPSWVNTDTVHVVYHKDIIPEKFLPVFCSTSIEMFLGFIPGLADNFIYANDDTFVAKTCKISDFFVDGKPVLNYTVSRSGYNLKSEYERQLFNSLTLSARIAGKSVSGKVVPPHSVNPMTVSSYREVWDSAKEDIEKEITKFRKETSFNQYLFSFHSLITGNYARNPESTAKYIGVKGRSVSSVCKEVSSGKWKTVCINDDGGNFMEFKKSLVSTFKNMFPKASIYEIPEKLTVHLYTLCYNEMALMPFAVDYWRTVADKIFVLDNGSNDGSVEYLKQIPGVTIIPFGDGSGFNDRLNMRVKNHVWKASRGKADFVIVTDFDEFMFSPNGLREELCVMRDRGETICKPRGYNVYSETFPEYEKGKLCHEICGKAIPDKMFNKVAIFNPDEIKEIRYDPGAHGCRPLGNVRWYTGDSIFLLHHKNLGLDYILSRSAAYRKRLSGDNKRNGWGIQYDFAKEKVTKDFADIYMKCENIDDIFETTGKTQKETQCSDKDKNANGNG